MMRRYIQDIDRELNRAILALAPRFEVRDVAPEFTAASHPQALQELVTSSGLIVWSGGSDATIYGDAIVNYAFRAWHDQTHLSKGLRFDLAGETATCEAQIQDLFSRFPSAPKRWAALLRADIVGQAKFFFETGSFPIDQCEFVRQYLSN